MAESSIFLTFDVGASFVKYGVFRGNTLVSSGSASTDKGITSNRIVEQLIEEVERTQSELTYGEKLKGVGVATAGIVDAAEGNVIYASELIPGYTGTQLKNRIEREVLIPVAVENDVNAMAIGEYGSRKKDFVIAPRVANKDVIDIYLTVGTGLGVAILQNGELIRGFNGLASYGGNILIRNRKGEIVKLEDIVTYRFVEQQYQEITGKKIEYSRLIREYNSKGSQEIDKRILQCILSEMYDTLSTYLTNLILTINPRSVILGGGVVETSAIVEEISRRVEEKLVPVFKTTCQISKAKYGNLSALYGMQSICTRQPWGVTGHISKY